MSKLSRRIRAQRRARAKQLKQQQRQARRQQKAHDQAPPESPQRPDAAAAPAAATSAGPGDHTQPTEAPAAGGRPGPLRVAAGLTGVGLLAALAGSAASDVSSHPDEARQVPATYVAAPSSVERLVCPPTPGAPDELSETGVLDYDERDESVESIRSGLLFGASEGTIPAADWISLTHQGPGAETSFTSGGEAEAEPSRLLAERPRVAERLEEADLPAVLQVQPSPETEPQLAPAAAAGYSYHAAQGSLTGLATAPCVPPQRSAWFLGPATGAGATSLLTLSNPYDRDARVEVTTYDSSGPTGSLGAVALVVPAESTRSVSMAALTEGASHIAVHMQASGAPVAAHMASSEASGSAGLGTELLPAQTSPGTEHHMLAVPAGADQLPRLWIHTPGEEGGTVELQVFDAEGQAPIETPGVFTVEAGQLAVVDLEGLQPGTYDVVVRTEQPSVAAVRSAGDGEPVTVETEMPAQTDPVTGELLEPETVEEETEPAPDFSWSAPVTEAQPGHGAVLPPTGETELRLFGAGRISYRLLDSDGAATEDVTLTLQEGQPTQVSAEELTEQAQDAGLEDLYAVVVTDVEATARVGTLTRTEEGHFSIGALQPISPTEQYVPLRFG